MGAVEDTLILTDITVDSHVWYLGLYLSGEVI